MKETSIIARLQDALGLCDFLSDTKDCFNDYYNNNEVTHAAGITVVSIENLISALKKADKKE